MVYHRKLAMHDAGCPRENPTSPFSTIYKRRTWKGRRRRSRSMHTVYMWHVCLCCVWLHDIIRPFLFVLFYFVLTYFDSMSDSCMHACMHTVCYRIRLYVNLYVLCECGVCMRMYNVMCSAHRWRFIVRTSIIISYTRVFKYIFTRYTCTSSDCVWTSERESEMSRASKKLSKKSIWTSEKKATSKPAHIASAWLTVISEFEGEPCRPKGTSYLQPKF